MEGNALTRALELCSEAQNLILAAYPEGSDAASIAAIDLAQVTRLLSAQIRYEETWGKTGDYEAQS